MSVGCQDEAEEEQGKGLGVAHAVVKDHYLFFLSLSLSHWTVAKLSCF